MSYIQRQSIAMNGGAVMVQLALTLALFLSFRCVQGQETIYLLQGELHGTIMTTRNGRNISAYLGIPYAEPPVGPLRFKNPQNLNDWGSVMMGDTDGNQCPQFNDVGVLVGDEDCLYLNVYTPKALSADALLLYPTMVYFHGGDFVKGSGSSIDAGPEYLLDKDIVLVTVNYRLGVLGFLSTGDAQAPGNFGLKDQALALKWVQNNIVLFTGDSRRVTIFGQGAGGVSTTLHAISDASDGLFNQYISQSGNGLNFWAYEDIDVYKKRATDLGKYLNCPTDNSQVLVDCLRNVDAYNLVDSNDIFNDRVWLYRTWGPTDEPEDLEGAFLTRFPLHVMLIDNKGTKDYPAMIGNVADEGLLLTAGFYANSPIYNTIASDPFAFLMSVVEVFFVNEKLEATTKSLQDYYFNGTQPTDKEAFTHNMTNFITDVSFRHPTDKQTTIMYYSTKTPFYAYTFDYRGTFSKTSATIGNNDNVGVTHGDDLTYLFPVKNVDLQLSESDKKMINIMVDFWTSFAYTGTPTSQYISDPNVWQPYVYETESYLKIGGNSDPMDIQQYPEIDERLNFWDMLLGIQIFDFFSLK